MINTMGFVAQNLDVEGRVCVMLAQVEFSSLTMIRIENCLKVLWYGSAEPSLGTQTST